MTPEQWLHVKELFSCALDCAPAQRAEFLAQTWPSEDVVRAEVHRLLSNHESLEAEGSVDSSFMPRPIIELTAPVTSSSKSEFLWRHLNHYRILSRLGTGGMAEVFRAHDERLRRDVAIKVLPEISSRDGEHIRRFNVEAQLLASLSHLNIGSIYNFEEDEGTYFLVLELIEGETLADRISRGPLPLEEGLEIGRQIAAALDAAHAKGIVHLDLKPANIKITPDGTVKVLDFGIARIFKRDVTRKSVSDSMAASSDSAMIAGTPSFMSPEQVRGDAVDSRADIWAWGCVMYEMLTGCRAFADERVVDVMRTITSSDIDWSRLRVPARIGVLVRRCLERAPHSRLQHIVEARVAIENEQRRLAFRRHWVRAALLGAFAFAMWGLFDYLAGG